MLEVKTKHKRCPVAGFDGSAGCTHNGPLTEMVSHLNSVHADILLHQDYNLLTGTFGRYDRSLAICKCCRAVFLNVVGHVCQHQGRLMCPWPPCKTSHETKQKLAKHLRYQHQKDDVSPQKLSDYGLFKCAKGCNNYYAETYRRKHKCPGKSTKPTFASRPSIRSDEAKTHLAPAISRPEAPDPADLEWLFGDPSSKTFSWCFVPLILCALGMRDHGGLTEHYAGPVAWALWRDSYAAQFVHDGITVASLPFDEHGYLPRTAQERLLLGPLSGGESNVDRVVEGAMTDFASRLNRVYQARAKPAAHPSSSSAPVPNEASEGGSDEGLEDLTQPAVSPVPAPAPARAQAGQQPPTRGRLRLSLADLAEHSRTWWFVPAGCEGHWITANQPRWRELIRSHERNDRRALGLAIDDILSLVADSLVRKRGGRRKMVKAVNRRLRSVAQGARGTLPLSSSDVHPLSLQEAAAFSPAQGWKAKLRRASERGCRGNTRKCVDCLTQDGLAAWNEARVACMREKHPPQTTSNPACPPSAPHTIFDEAD